MVCCSYKNNRCISKEILQCDGTCIHLAATEYCIYSYYYIFVTSGMSHGTTGLSEVL